MVLRKSAVLPTAVFSVPSVLDKRAIWPTAVFRAPLVLRKSAPSPTAVLSRPVRVKFPAFRPRNVLWVPNEWRNRAPFTWNCPVRGVVRRQLEVPLKRADAIHGVDDGVDPSRRYGISRDHRRDLCRRA